MDVNRIFRTAGALAAREDLGEVRFRERILPLPFVRGGKVRQEAERVRMLRSKNAAARVERLFEERLGLAVGEDRYDWPVRESEAGVESALRVARRDEQTGHYAARGANNAVSRSLSEKGRKLALSP